MNIQDMHIEFRLAFDKLESSAYPDYQVEEVDYLLNEAINRFVKTRYSQNNIYNMGFEELQKRTDDLRTLVVTKFIAATASTIENNSFTSSLASLYNDEAISSLSTDKYLFLVRLRSLNTKTGCTPSYEWVKLVRHDSLDYLKNDPFNKPYIKQSLGYFEGNNITIVTDGTYSITKCKITCIKHPAIVKYGAVYPTPVTNVDCDLPDHTHKEIIQLACQIALENIESPRQQTQAAQLRNIE